MVAILCFGTANRIGRATLTRPLSHAMLVTGLWATGWLCAITAIIFGIVAWKGYAG